MRTQRPSATPNRTSRELATTLMAEAIHEAAVAAGSESAREVEALWDAVSRAVAGAAAAPAVATPVRARHRLDLARRSFIARLRAEGDRIELQDALRLLDALEQVRASLEPRRPTAADAMATPAELELLAEAAHDIRSPLAAVVYLVDALRGGQAGPLTPEQERQIALIYSATFELSALANDLTELAHGGGLPLLEREPVVLSLAAVLESVRDIVRPIAEERQLEVRVAQSAADARRGHPAALARVLLNLVTNALRHTATGFVELGAADRGSGRVELWVRDSGPGISADAMDRLFEPFQLRTRTRRRGLSSSGLGLAICRTLVHAMGGELAVESASGKGARLHFTVGLPHVDATEDSVGR